MKKYFVYLFTILLAVVPLTLVMGDTPWDIVWKGAMDRLFGNSQQWNPLLDERLPRLIVILCSGASLGVSGAVMQSLFHNPLASPSVLGVSCGGSLFVVVTIIFGWHLHYPYSIPIAAFSGCLLTLLLIYMLTRYSGEVNLYNLILTGVALSTLLVAVQGAIMYALRDRWQLIQTITEWVSGSTVDRSWKHVHMQLPLTLVGLFGCWNYRHEINILALGEEEANSLGVDVLKVRWRLFLCVSLLTAGTIAAVGFISFFGLVLPHILRKICGPDNRKLIPLCMLSGGIALAVMDFTLRFFELNSFSLGNISAIIGGIFFLILLPQVQRKAVQSC